MKPDEVEPGTYVAPSEQNPWPVVAPVEPAEDAVPIVMDRDLEHRIPEINLLHTAAPQLATVANVEAKPEVPAITAVATVSQGAGSKRKPMALVVGILLVLTACAIAAYFVLLNKTTTANLAVTHSPSPTPAVSTSPSASPSPTASASPTPSPTSMATPIPTTVTAPSVAPTSSAPQAVTITAKSGLWLRSSPNSSNSKNIIDWMPIGSEVSVDSIGSFWWHGTYKGKTGYFASKYTQ